MYAKKQEFEELNQKAKNDNNYNNSTGQHKSNKTNWMCWQ